MRPWNSGNSESRVAFQLSLLASNSLPEYIGQTTRSDRAADHAAVQETIWPLCRPRRAFVRHFKLSNLVSPYLLVLTPRRSSNSRVEIIAALGQPDAQIADISKLMTQVKAQLAGVLPSLPAYDQRIYELVSFSPPFDPCGETPSKRPRVVL